MRYEAVFPLFLRRQMANHIVSRDQGGKGVLACLKTILVGLENREEDSAEDARVGAVVARMGDAGGVQVDGRAGQSWPVALGAFEFVRPSSIL